MISPLSVGTETLSMKGNRGHVHARGNLQVKPRVAAAPEGVLLTPVLEG